MSLLMKFLTIPAALVAIIAVERASVARGADVLESAVAADNECPPYGTLESGGCALSALQLQGRKLRSQSEAKAEGAEEASEGVRQSKFISNRESKSFHWTPTTYDVEGALSKHWPQGQQPFGQTPHSLASWLKSDLLDSDPFGSGGNVLLPWPPSGDDQLGDGGYVGYSRRQVCYITAKVYLGARTEGYDSGLDRLMTMCGNRQSDFMEAFVDLLAACAADPGLQDGQQGPLLLTAKAGAAPSVEAVRAAAQGVDMAAAGLRVCDYDTDAQTGLDQVPSDGCVPRSDYAPGKDFMTGGLAGQATQDISAAWFGGYLFDAKACGLGGGQDERLSVYFPEVTVLAYFLSSSHPFPQLRQPAWVLGARNFFTGLDGTARFDKPLKLADVPLDSDLKEVEVAGSTYLMSSSRPFVIFMSESQGYLGGENSQNLPRARRNREPRQRDVGSGKFAFEKQVRAWYRSMALTSYSEEVRPAMKALVHSVGVGPWLSGLWWGDSQLGFLAIWLGQAIAAPTWGQPLPVDYYIYSDFTENPGNQCFVHASAACQACMRKCASPEPPRSAYWMPHGAFMNGQACVLSAEDCGASGLEDVVKAFGSGDAATLWQTVETKVRGQGVRRTVFDELL